MKCGLWIVIIFGLCCIAPIEIISLTKTNPTRQYIYNWSSTCYNLQIVYTWERHKISHTQTQWWVVILQKSCQVDGRIWIEWLRREWIYGLNLAYISCCKTKCGGFGDMKSFGGEDEIGFREKADPSSYVIAPWINLKIHVWCIPYTYS